MWFKSKRQQRHDRLQRRRKLALCARGQRSVEPLEQRLLLTIMAQPDTYNTLNTSALNVAAPGVLANDSDMGGYQMTAHLYSNPSHGSVTLNGDGSFTYTADTGYYGTDTFQYYDTDTQNNTSGNATVTVNVGYGVQSAADATKQAVDTIHVPLQILGDSSGQPATAHNLSILYDSGTAVPDQVLEGNYQLAMNPVASNVTLTMSASFNGQNQAQGFVTTGSMTGSNPTIHISTQVSATALGTGRYPYSMTLTDMGTNSFSSTISGAANVDNESSNSIGAGWQMPGLYHLTSNNVNGIAAGVLLTTGDADGAFYFTQGSGNSYASAAGAFAFSTLTSVTGGGWKLVDQHGVTHNFNSAGDLTSVVLPNTETTTYGWTSGLLTLVTSIEKGASPRAEKGATWAQKVAPCGA